MTVADIQEYIDNTHQAILEKQCSAEDKILDYDLLMFQVKSMLNELEDRPKANWIKQDYSTGYSEHGTASICSKCGSEVISKTNYCSNCGAKMNDELKENNK